MTQKSNPILTAQALNLKIRKLGKEHHMYSQSDFKEMFLYLYNQDDKFEKMNKRSILILLSLNLRYRVMSLHNFGIRINLSSQVNDQ